MQSRIVERKTFLNALRRRGLLCVLPALVLALCACYPSVSSQASATSEFVACRITVANRGIAPGSYGTGIDLYFDHGALHYVKNENTFHLRYREPVIVLTDYGMRIDFGLIPSSCFQPPLEIVLYFLPIKKGETAISGRVLARKHELFLGPRHGTKTRQLRAVRVAVPMRHERKGAAAFQFTGYPKSGTEKVRGKQTDISIPSGVESGRAVRRLRELLSGFGFTGTGEIGFDGGTSLAFVRHYPGRGQAVEIRATFETGKPGTNLHLFAYGNADIDGLFAAIDKRYREMISE